jgi:hypothetical protein
MTGTPRLSCAVQQVSQAAKLVGDGPGGLTACGALERVLDALEVNCSTSHGQHFADILITLLALKPPDLKTQVAAAVLEHVDFEDTPWVLDYGIYADALAHGTYTITHADTGCFGEHFVTIRGSHGTIVS